MAAVSHRLDFAIFSTSISDEESVMINSREQYLKRFDMEQPTFARVLRALPEDQLSYKPHERSTAAGDLAWQISEEQRVLSGMLATGDINWETKPRPSTLAEIISAYETNSAALREAVGSSDDEKWDSTARFMFGDQVGGTSTVGDFLWGFLFDMVHHRGQLSAYIRPMGGKVPSIYGPSADSDSGGGE
jgi:uncharacterized damage-inducible protein DinB